jgi:hypothetical protein
MRTPAARLGNTFLRHLPRSYSTGCSALQDIRQCGYWPATGLCCRASVLEIAGSSYALPTSRDSCRKYYAGRVLVRVYLYHFLTNWRSSPDGAHAVALPEIQCLGACYWPPKAGTYGDLTHHKKTNYGTITKIFPSLFFLRQSYATLLRGCDHDSSCPVGLLVCRRIALLLWCPHSRTLTSHASPPAPARDHWLPTLQTLDLYLSGDVGLCTLRIHRSMKSRSPGSNNIPSTYI